MIPRLKAFFPRPVRGRVRRAPSGRVVGAALAVLTLTCARPMPPTGHAPVLGVALYQHLRTVQAHSEAQVALDGVLDDSPAVVSAPVRVRYGRDPQDPLGFTLPPGNYVMLQQLGGFVYGVRASPQLGAGSLDDGLRAVRAAERAIDASGWRKAPGTLTDDAVRAYAGGAEPPRDLPVARWTAAREKVTLSLKRALDAPPGAPLFFASVAVEDTDDQRFERYREALHARRRQLGAAPGASLPITRMWNDTTPPGPATMP